MGLLAMTTPGDIVLDMARAVDPSIAGAARAQLADRAGAASPGGVFPLTEAIANRPASAKTEAAEPLKRFEAMVLQTFIQNMLPSDAGSVYGKGMAGDMWKSLMAEQLAETMAERGGIGIAERVLGDHYVEGEKKLPVGAVSNGPERTAMDGQTLLSTALVEELQRRTVGALAEDEVGAGGATLFRKGGE